MEGPRAGISGSKHITCILHGKEEVNQSARVPPFSGGSLGMGTRWVHLTYKSPIIRYGISAKIQ
jgi:hypothetical protein